MKKLVSTFILSSFIAVAATPALAETLTFSRDGEDYVADVTTSPTGVTKIVGRNLTTYTAFNLKLVKNHVSGVYGASTMAFQTPKQNQVIASR